MIDKSTRAADVAHVVAMMNRLNVSYYDLGAYQVMQNIEDRFAGGVDKAFALMCEADVDFVPGAAEHEYDRQRDDVEDRARDLDLWVSDDEDEDEN